MSFFFYGGRFNPRRYSNHHAFIRTFGFVFDVDGFIHAALS